MVTSSLSERRGAGPGRSKACWIMADPFIVSSTMVKMVVRTVALSSIGSTLLVCLSCLQTTAYYSSPFLSATSTKRNWIYHQAASLLGASCPHHCIRCTNWCNTVLTLCLYRHYLGSRRDMFCFSIMACLVSFSIFMGFIKQ